MSKVGMDTHDTLNRRSRYHRTTTGKRVTLKPRDRRWLQALRDHGPMPSTFLHAFTRADHACKKSSRMRLTDLFNENNTPDGGPYLARPMQQRCVANGLNKPLVYDLGNAAWAALEQRKSSIHRASGPFHHQLMVATVTAAVELACFKTDHVRYIPGWRLLERAKAHIGIDVRIPLPNKEWPERHRLVPDQLFALEYRHHGKSTYLAFLVECDRGTEPIESTSNARKSYLRSYLQYREFVGAGLYRVAYGLKAPCVVLNVMSSNRRRNAFMNLVSRKATAGNSFMLFKSIEGIDLYRGPENLSEKIVSGWHRIGYDKFDLQIAHQQQTELIS